MIDPNKIAFDIDSVIADTMSLFLDIARKEYGLTGKEYKDITEYDLTGGLDISAEIMEDIIEKIIDSDYSMLLEPIEGAGEVLKRVLNASEGLLFVTSRPRIGRLKEWFSSKFMPDISYDSIEIIATGCSEAKKDKLLERNKTWFIDDRLETCFDLDKAGITPIVYVQPWNLSSHSFLKVDNWQDIERLIEFEKK